MADDDPHLGSRGLDVGEEVLDEVVVHRFGIAHEDESRFAEERGRGEDVEIAEGVAGR